MKRKIIILVIAAIILLFAWAPWLDDKQIHDRILRERGWIDGTITSPEHLNLTDEALEKLLEESRKLGIKNGIILCDYNVMWFPFGRYVASCEGGYYVTFWGEPVYWPSGRGGVILP
ncbi:MAG: hypothetical protein GXO63_02140 [Candidatus Micrarchaeota archaeon]|nr:hypothetical protein [Candidatus Micrarchaeota archaeon]